jgi:hypothetical protein
MAGGYLQIPYKILNVTITTNDPLTAQVLKSARAVKRLNAVLGMMLEAYLATPEGQVMAAQQLRVPLSDLPNHPLESASTSRVAAPHAISLKGGEIEQGRPHGKSGINLDNVVS